MVRFAVAFTGAIAIVACTQSPRPRSPTAEVKLVLAEDPLDASVPSDVNVDANRVVIPAPDISGVDRNYWRGTWPVSDQDAEHADEGVEGYVRTEDPAIADNLGDYYGQIFGVIDASGRKLIHFNFVCSAGIRELDNLGGGYRLDWKHDLVLVNDGGHCYFHLDFDPATGEYEGFQTNGEA